MAVPFSTKEEKRLANERLNDFLAKRNPVSHIVTDIDEELFYRTVSNLHDIICAPVVVVAPVAAQPQPTKRKSWWKPW
jgi:hypothetical protein